MQPCLEMSLKNYKLNIPSFWPSMLLFSRKCHCLGDVFCSRSWVSYTDTRQSEYKYLSEPASEHAVPSLQASPNQPAIFMQDDTRHAAKQAKQFLEAKNIEIMKCFRVLI